MMKLLYAPILIALLPVLAHRTSVPGVANSSGRDWYWIMDVREVRICPGQAFVPVGEYSGWLSDAPVCEVVQMRLWEDVA